jgi:hypothetical protein
LKGDVLEGLLSRSYDSEYYEEKLKPRGLTSAKQLIWMRFANDGHLGVVAASNDINFDSDTNSYKIIKSCNLEWDTSFVLIFPLNPLDSAVGNKHSRDEAETAVGNYLSDKRMSLFSTFIPITTIKASSDKREA